MGTNGQGIAAMTDGAKDTFDRFYESHYSVAVRFVRTKTWMVGADVEDLVSAVFVAIWKYWPRLQPGSTAYLFKCLGNAAKKRYPQGVREVSLDEEFDIKDPALDPFDEALDGQTKELLNDLLGQCPGNPEENVRLFWSRFEDMPFERLAVEFGCTQEAIRRRYNRLDERVRQIASSQGVLR